MNEKMNRLIDEEVDEDPSDMVPARMDGGLEVSALDNEGFLGGQPQRSDRGDDRQNKQIRTMLDGSWNQRIPTITVPTAPIPPHTA